MKKNEIVFETKLKLLQYFLAFFRALIFIPTALLILIFPKSKSLTLVLFISFVIFEIFIFFYHLKTYQLSKTEFKIKKPFLFKNYSYKFNEIKKIEFYNSSSSFTAGSYIKVVTQKNEKSFMLLFDRVTLDAFIKKLNEQKILTINRIPKKL